jgi:hypothetical protein
MFTGSAKFDWHVDDDERWVNDTVTVTGAHFRNAPEIWREMVVDHVQTASLGCIYSKETARRDAIGFSVRDIDFYADPYDPHDRMWNYGWSIRLGLRGNDVHFFRVNFQFTVLVSSELE